MTTADARALTYRVARPEDTKAIETLDGSFTTATVFRVTVAEEGFTLREVPVDPPLHKVFPDDGPDEEESDADDEDARTYVAVGDDGLAGFVALSYGDDPGLGIEPLGHQARGPGLTGPGDRGRHAV
ncbi:GNAT family N-acetyltransferase, partial [Streptomyces sp. NPDC005409]